MPRSEVATARRIFPKEDPLEGLPDLTLGVILVRGQGSDKTTPSLLWTLKDQILRKVQQKKRNKRKRRKRRKTWMTPLKTQMTMLIKFHPMSIVEISNGNNTLKILRGLSDKMTMSGMSLNLFTMRSMLMGSMLTWISSTMTTLTIC